MSEAREELLLQELQKLVTLLKPLQMQGMYEELLKLPYADKIEYIRCNVAPFEPILETMIGLIMGNKEVNRNEMAQSIRCLIEIAKTY